MSRRVTKRAGARACEDKARALAAILLCGLLAACSPGETDAPSAPPLTFLGEAVIGPQPAVPGDPEIGGLSSISHIGGGVYYAISDDPGRRGPARYYVLSIDLADGQLDAADATVTGWHELFDADGKAFLPDTYDLEGMVALDDNLFISSEGNAAAGIEPFVAVFGPQRRMMEPLGLPSGFAPAADGSSGVRDNLAFEGLAITPDNRYLFTGTESALAQDGPPATPEAGSTSRILRFDRDHGVFDAQFAYPVEAVHSSAPQAGGLEANGLAELLALSGEHLLALERSFVAGVPQPSIKLFDVCLAEATDISGIESLAVSETEVVPASKRLVADLADLVPRLDNVEGMTFGPRLASGEQTLIFVSDNNFAPQRQITQILAFSVAPDAIRGCTPR